MQCLKKGGKGHQTRINAIMRSEPGPKAGEDLLLLLVWSGHSCPLNAAAIACFGCFIGPWSLSLQYRHAYDSLRISFVR